jgi:hypothetical protein
MGKVKVIPTREDLQKMLDADVLMDDDRYDQGFKDAIKWMLKGEEVDSNFDIPDLVSNPETC